MTPSDSEQALAATAREAARIALTVRPYLPPSLVPLFDAGFVHSDTLYDEFVYRLTIRVVRDAGLAAALREWGSAEEAVARAGLDPERSRIPVGWMLRHLAGRGTLARQDTAAGARYRAAQPLPDLEPAAVVAEQRAHDPTCLPSYALAETAARDYPAFLRRERSGEEILLAPARLPLWTGYFSNDNILYAVNNRVGAVAFETWIRPEAHAVLELGGGLASGAAAVLERLAEAGRLGDIRTYRFTELVPPFLSRGKRLLEQRFPDGAFLSFARLDMNQPFAAQGVEPESASVVYAVNTLHVAHDLAGTLGEVRRALRPGGHLVLSECIRPRPGDTLYPEFVFNLLETFRSPRLASYRPNGGFLTPEQWTGALQAAGFADIRVLPDVARIRDVCPTFYVAAFAGTRPA